MFYSKFLISLVFLMFLASGPVHAELCAPFKNGKIDPKVYTALVQAANQNKLYRFGGTASQVGFCVDRALGDRVTGAFDEYYGGLAMPLGPDQEGQVVLLVRANSLATGDQFIDKMARGPSFFNVDEHPDILFVSREIEWLGMTEARLHGDLTMHGTTRPITFEVKLTDADEQDPEHAGHIHLAATTTVDRSDFNMNSFPVMLSNQVNLCIEFEAELVRNEPEDGVPPALTRKSP